MTSIERSGFWGAIKAVMGPPVAALALAITTAACGGVSVEKGGDAAAGGGGTGGSGGAGGGDAGAQMAPEELAFSSFLMMLRESSTGVFVYATGIQGESGIFRFDKETSASSLITKTFIDD